VPEAEREGDGKAEGKAKQKRGSDRLAERYCLGAFVFALAPEQVTDLLS